MKEKYNVRYYEEGNEIPEDLRDIISSMYVTALLNNVYSFPFCMVEGDDLRIGLPTQDFRNIGWIWTE